jgi:hypothetical protein
MNEEIFAEANLSLLNQLGFDGTEFTEASAGGHNEAVTARFHGGYGCGLPCYQDRPR